MVKIPTVGVVGYATTQGLGYLAKSFYDAGVVQEMLVYEHPDGRPTRTEWYPGASVARGRDFASNPMMRERLGQFLDNVEIVLFFETPHDWNLLPILRRRGIRSVLVPMYEWSLENPPYPFDRVICPSKLDQRYFPGARYLPIPVDGSRWRLRTKALRFLHNGGGIGSREHKGTRQLLEALPYVRSRDFRLTVRAQNSAALRRIVDADPVIARDSRLTVEYGERPYEDLWDGYDVLVQPEKYNGLSLPLQEAFAAGMVVMTTDRFPANDWLPRATLIPVERTQRVQVARGHNWIDESIVSPEEIARTIDAWFGRDVEELSRIGRVYGERNSWTALRGEWVREIARAKGRPA